MSRSFKKAPICGFTTAKSEKQDKTRANRKYRRLIKLLLKRKQSETLFPKIKEISNICNFSKDGKHYFGNIKDIKYLKKLRGK